MRPILAASILTLLTTPAFAQSADVAVSLGGDKDRESAGGRTAVRASVGVQTDSDYHPSEKGGIFEILFTRSPGEIYGAQAQASAELARYEGDTGGDTDFYFDQSAIAGAFGWEVGQRFSYQTRTSFADPFWRSSRGLAAVGLDVAMAPMMSIVVRDRWFIGMGGGRLSLTEFPKHVGTSLSSADWDVDFDLDFFRVAGPKTRLQIFSFRVREYGTRLSRQGNTTKGLAVSAGDFDIVDLTLDLRDDVSLVAKAGLRFRVALAPYTSTTTEDSTSSHHMGEAYTTPIAWLGAEVRESGSLPFSIAVGGGAASRVSPDSFGVDSGIRGEATVNVDLGDRASVAVSADIASLERGSLSQFATEDTPGLGTRYLLARGAAEFTLPLAERISLVAKGYAEKTDRDNPRTHKSAPDPEGWAYGVELSASFAVGKSYDEACATCTR